MSEGGGELWVFQLDSASVSTAPFLNGSDLHDVALVRMLCEYLGVKISTYCTSIRSHVTGLVILTFLRPFCQLHFST